jgi:hypothetical protein
MIVLCVAALAVAVLALPGGAKEKPLPDQVVLEGVWRLGAVEARTGEYAGDSGPFPEGYIGKVPGWANFMDPKYNYCDTTVTLTWIGKNTARLVQQDDVVKGTDGVWRCPTRGTLPAPKPGGVHERIVHITKGGALKMAPIGEFWKNVPALTGCDLNGTFPVYHGHFDGETLTATSHLHSFCDGGTAWSKFGIGAEDGPIHLTYELDLQVVSD